MMFVGSFSLSMSSQQQRPQHKVSIIIVRAAAVKLLPGRRMRPIQPFTMLGSICIYYF